MVDKMTEAIVLFAILVFAATVIVIAIRSDRRPVISHCEIPTLTEYRQRHPELFEQGQPSCRQCGSSQLVHRPGGHQGSKDVDYHVCAYCGAALYRSED